MLALSMHLLQYLASIITISSNNGRRSRMTASAVGNDGTMTVVSMPSEISEDMTWVV